MSDQPYYEALPASLKPSRYHVSVFDIDITKESFKGKVTIELDVVKPTQELHLNYRDLTVTKEGITVQHGEDVIAIESITEFKSKEYFFVKLEETVSQGKLVVTLEYDGIIQTNMAGFYKSSYLEDGEEKFMLSTQFEATDARRAFPCLDEPSLKATFVVDITLNSQWTCLGNTPVASTESVSDDLQKVTFEETPIMSTYLLAWACGDFEYIESFTKDTYHNDKPLPVRIYTTKGGYLADAQLASEITPKIVDYFSQIFEIKYPLPKLDLLAVHSFSHNAMENWGLITYRSTALLYSEAKSDPSYKQKVAYVVAHELAHQWFGNLVTMKWWDELWLNEGFATWVGYAAVDYLFPEWDIFSGFVSESLQQALNLDGLRNSHPIEVPVIDALDIDQVFDAISYLKGASTILMISNYLGRDLFLKGVAKYLNENKYSNATSHDLWSSIGEVSGKPIDQLMNSWIKKVGFPIVNVDVHENSLVLTQSRFLNSGDLTTEENETKWWIPLNFVDGGDITIDSFESETLIIDQFPLIDKYFKLNKDTSGVYRVNYSSAILEKNILPFFDKLSPRDKVGLIADSAATAISGNNSTAEFLKLVRNIAGKLGNDYVVWLELGKRLGDVATAFSTSEIRPKVDAFIRAIYQDKAVELVKELASSTTIDSADFLKVKLRSEILKHAGLLSIPEVEQYAQVLFESWLKDPSTLHPSLRSFVFTTVAASAKFTNAQFQSILKEVTHPSSLDSREISLRALGHITNVELLQPLLDLLTQPEVIPTMDSHFLGAPLSDNPVTRDAFLQFFFDNYDDKLYKLMSTNMVVLDRFVKMTLRNYQSEEVYNKVSDFFRNRDVHGFERSLKQSLDNIKINSTWFGRDGKAVDEYLS
ncbi:arginine/alanine aminopeptidase [Spathaspora passalidarum NRRL Y-27907]|uniref:Aminopeptidase n=1 Tax=Spathaspora passalidarum (strain NRRL Y-27907 / 11-Y1) TaxID=619300 RepID=G3AK31_SPAPN|nr:arginine/alanine aminopeptidase [Spathaspora passalidarum NRRL Y-27907]EGW32842.1 arginine/alanine aminopeptidase [Spathaspora passalidarum NRRL Y-27907]